MGIGVFVPDGLSPISYWSVSNVLRPWTQPSVSAAPIGALIYRIPRPVSHSIEWLWDVAWRPNGKWAFAWRNVRDPAMARGPTPKPRDDAAPDPPVLPLITDPLD